MQEIIDSILPYSLSFLFLLCIPLAVTSVWVLFNGAPNWVIFKNSIEKLREVGLRAVGRASIMCPFCLQMIPQNSEKCASCDQEIPPIYKQRYFKQPIITLNAVGFREHGKTVYLTSLFYTSEQLARSPNVWGGFAEEALNADSMEKILGWSYDLRQRKLPEANDRSDFAKPSIHLFQGLPFSSPDRLLLIYDTSGEHYQTVSRLKQYAQFIKNSPVVLFFISMPTIRKEKDSPDLVLRRLMEVYRHGMADMGKDTRNQHLIIVYTQADAMLEDLARYPKIIQHLHKPVDYVPRSIEELQGISNQLSDYTRSFAANFHNNATKNFASVRCCIVSALGHAPNSSNPRQLDFDIAPKRVFDPLIWLIYDTGLKRKHWWTANVHEEYKGK